MSQPRQSQSQSQSQLQTPFSLPELNFDAELLKSDPEQGSQAVSDLRSRFESFDPHGLSTRASPSPLPPRIPAKTPIQAAGLVSSSEALPPARPPKPPLLQGALKTDKSEATPPTLNNLPLPSPLHTDTPDVPKSPGVSALRSKFDESGSLSTRSGEGAGVESERNQAVHTITSNRNTLPGPNPGQISRATSYGFPTTSSSSSIDAPAPPVPVRSGQRSSSSLPTPPAVPAKPKKDSQSENVQLHLQSPPERVAHFRSSSSGSLGSKHRAPPPVPSRESTRSREDIGNTFALIEQTAASSGTPNDLDSRGPLTSSSSSHALVISPTRSDRSNSTGGSWISQSSGARIDGPAVVERAPALPSRRTGGLEFLSQPVTKKDPPLPPPPQRHHSSFSTSRSLASGANGNFTSSTLTFSEQQTLSPTSVIPPIPPSRGPNSNALPPPVRSAAIPIAVSSSVPPPSIKRPASIRPSEDTSDESDLDEDFDVSDDEKDFEKEREIYHDRFLHESHHKQHKDSHSPKSPFGVISSSLSAWKHGKKLASGLHPGHTHNHSSQSLGSASPSSLSTYSSSSSVPTSPGILNPKLNGVGSNRSMRKDNDLPDSSNVNRRPPTFNPDCSVSSKATFHDFSIFGHTIVTACDKGVKIYRIGTTAHNGGEKLCSVGEGGKQSENRLTQVTFRVENEKVGQEGRYAWCGTRSGEIWELDTVEAEITTSRLNLHSSPISLLTRVGKKGGMLSLDEGGKLCVWCPSPDTPNNLSSSPRTQRIPMDKYSMPLALGDQLWVCSPAEPYSKSSSSTPSSQLVTTSSGPKIRIYNLFSDDKPFNAVSRPVSIPSALVVGGIGSVTCGTIIPTSQDLVYLGHDTGHVSIWNRTSLTCIKVQKLGAFGVTAMVGVHENLWIGNKTGKISIYRIDVRDHWIVKKRWQAHNHPITDLKVDINEVDGKQRLQVASSANDSTIQIWDGLLSFDWLDHQLNEKEIEKTFCSEREIRILQCTFNIDASSPSELEEGEELELNWLESLLKSGREDYEQIESEAEEVEILPDVIVFGLQEVIDLESKALTAKNLLMGRRKGKEDMGERISHQYRAWYDRLVLAVRLALPPTTPYKPILSESLVGLFSIVFIKVSQLDRCRDMAVSTIKTGMGGRYGNKGAIVSRFVLDDTSFCFTNCHLAAGQKHVRQRNDDIADILEASPFEGLLSDPLAYTAGGEGSMILDHSKNFLSGDLNYRIDQPRSTVVSLLASRKLSSLLSADQLLTQLSSNPTFRLREFQEAQINFIPTYKHDRGTDEWDSSDKKRIPAWCDRVLWRCKVEDDVRNREYRRWDCRVSDHRPVSAVFDVKVKSIDPTKRAQASRILLESWKIEEARLIESATKYYSD